MNQLVFGSDPFPIKIRNERDGRVTKSTSTKSIMKKNTNYFFGLLKKRRMKWCANLEGDNLSNTVCFRKIFGNFQGARISTENDLGLIETGKMNDCTCLWSFIVATKHSPDPIAFTSVQSSLASIIRARSKKRRENFQLKLESTQSF